MASDDREEPNGRAIATSFKSYRLPRRVEAAAEHVDVSGRAHN
jgi:hypothetical protein